MRRNRRGCATSFRLQSSAINLQSGAGTWSGARPVSGLFFQFRDLLFQSFEFLASAPQYSRLDIKFFPRDEIQAGEASFQYAFEVFPDILFQASQSLWDRIG